MDGLLACTPPLEALGVLVGEAATVEDGVEENAIDIDDVSRAFFEAPAVRDVCVEFPEACLEGTKFSRTSSDEFVRYP